MKKILILLSNGFEILEAAAFIEHHRNDPFFLYVPYNAPHTPLQATLQYYERFPHIKDERKRVFAAMVSALDDGIGMILATLKKHRLDNNTLVIFLSDNGCALYTQACSNDPLRLGKVTPYEGGVRVPFCLKWPGQIPTGIVYNHAVSTLDIFPTILDAVNGEMPQDRVRDGVNLLPHLRGEETNRPHGMLFWRNGPNWAVRSENWKLFYAEDHFWLYDLSNDIGENTNLTAQKPAIVKTMTEAYREWDSRNVEPIWAPRSVIPYQLDGVNIQWHI